MFSKDFVERKAVLRAMKNMGVSRAFQAIQEMPAADYVELIHGEWTYDPYGGFHCSVCDCWFDDYYGATPERMNYCPFCGAKMKNCVLAEPKTKGGAE